MSMFILTLAAVRPNVANGPTDRAFAVYRPLRNLTDASAKLRIEKNIAIAERRSFDMGCVGQATRGATAPAGNQ